MFGIPKIKNLEGLVSQYIENKKKIVETRVTRHAFAREYYGSTVLDIDIVLKDETKYIQEILSVVAKLMPERKFFQKVFNCEVTFKNEAAFYKTVVPLLEGFQRERGITDELEYVPKFYGARLNLDEHSDNVDQNAVLILEQLSSKGRYKNKGEFVSMYRLK